jgi:hypothetical protein
MIILSSISEECLEALQRIAGKRDTRPRYCQNLCTERGRILQFLWLSSLLVFSHFNAVHEASAGDDLGNFFCPI